MRFERSPRWIVVVALIVIGACATKQDILVTKLRGRAAGHIYPVTLDQAWNISKTLFHLEPTDAIEEHRPDGYMLTSQNAEGLNAGTYMGVFIEPGERPGESKVTFIARRKSPTQAYPALGDGMFHKKFAELVSLLAAVGPLPAASDRPDAGFTPDAATSSDAGMLSD